MSEFYDPLRYWDTFERGFREGERMALTVRNPRAIANPEAVLEEIEREAIPDLSPLIPRSIIREIERYRRWKIKQEAFKPLDATE